MEQSIKIRIAGKEYPLKANSPEMEQMLRLAAETINQKLAEANSEAGKLEEDIESYLKDIEKNGR